ncbi:30S ribosomal protein S18 [Phycisphaera mikurensis]|uniref:Small ribosomal subunit protein bS18 n=1 Tax=Phycisphaera mikurensis (strain NBRC 102666 / KCTC 22515 / FYK2301M01) TaxID=1142394 RepID=I0IFG1_PHYMF|nr:30S ribosomal protein S18 [Phycisphaera mikurensis]MBB6440609.1 small subunit ribosomal protein S18 [Phycisphaera mikurensis]BAM03999.1 30S ribosomal protein S18 [Phycisphaera mikurensis NBRC 102666]
MSAFAAYTTNPPSQVVFRSSNGTLFCDYKNTEELRRYLTPNGKIQGRRKTGLTAREQRLLAQAIKRARHMSLLPFTSATL